MIASGSSINSEINATDQNQQSPYHLISISVFSRAIIFEIALSNAFLASLSANFRSESSDGLLYSSVQIDGGAYFAIVEAPLVHVRIGHDSIPSVNETTPKTVQDVDLASASILLVDDNLQNLELMQAFLEELPCSLRTASDGVEAIESIELSCPNLVILDVMMPRMSGFEVCQKIKSQPSTRDIVVIMVTALNEVSDYERAVECGTNDFITKPVNKLELITRVRTLLELALVKQGFENT